MAINERAHGMTPEKWARLRAKTNDQVLAEARADSAALPVEDRRAGGLGRVARVRPGREAFGNVSGPAN
jgi:hypothetical protein